MEGWPILIHRTIQTGRRIHNMLSYNAGRSSYSVVEHHIIMETYRMGSECGYEDIIRVTCYDKSTISRAVASLERKDIVECLRPS